MSRGGPSRWLAGLLVAVMLLLTSCDGFEPWEAALSDFHHALDEDIRESFTDEGHLVAYALAADCFQTLEPQSDRDRAIAAACVMPDWGVLSDIMTMRDLCEYLGASGSRDVERTNAGDLCANR